MEFNFDVGDLVKIADFPGYTGTVVLVTHQEVWLDMSPGAVGGYEWVLAHFPHSWCPDKPTIHAINRFPLDRVSRLCPGK